MGGSIAALGVGFAEYFGYFFPALPTQEIIFLSEVRTISVKGSYQHLGGAMSARGPERILFCSEVFPDNFFKGFDVIEVPHLGFNPSVGNVICLGENEVIANAAENMQTIKVLENNGVMVHVLSRRHPDPG